jgi:hypothetical protein
MTIQEILQILVVPIVVALLGIFWPAIQGFYRNKRLTNLILRELSEAYPHPRKPEPGGRWTNHMKRDFIHRNILKKASDNLDRILSLDPDISYKVGQLWAALENNNAGEWLHYWSSLAEKFQKREPQLHDVSNAWQALIHSYRQPAGSK